VHNDLNAMIEVVARPRLCLLKLHGGRNMIDDEASTFAGAEDWICPRGLKSKAGVDAHPDKHRILLILGE
jgi:hypothetical protein